MRADDIRQAMIARFTHAEAVCRICRSFRRQVPSLPFAAERAAVALALPVPVLVDRLQQIEEEIRQCR